MLHAFRRPISRICHSQPRWTGVRIGDPRPGKSTHFIQATRSDLVDELIWGKAAISLSADSHDFDSQVGFFYVTDRTVNESKYLLRLALSLVEQTVGLWSLFTPDRFNHRRACAVKLLVHNMATSGIFRIASDYFPLFVLLSILHSIWQFSEMVLPFLFQGRMWSASISLKAKRLLHIGQVPLCFS